jgi:hypothetical protein
LQALDYDKGSEVAAYQLMPDEEPLRRVGSGAEHAHRTVFLRLPARSPC